MTCSIHSPTRLAVETYAASWIEILDVIIRAYTVKVETYAASWIEIGVMPTSLLPLEVETYAASWIEIQPFWPRPLSA